MYFLLNLPNYLLVLKTEIKLPQLSAMGVLYIVMYISRVAVYQQFCGYFD